MREICGNRLRMVIRSDAIQATDAPVKFDK
jgi:hypothetical protein